MDLGASHLHTGYHLESKGTLVYKERSWMQWEFKYPAEMERKGTNTCSGSNVVPQKIYPYKSLEAKNVT